MRRAEGVNRPNGEKLRRAAQGELPKTVGSVETLIQGVLLIISAQMSGFGLSGNLLLDLSITSFDPSETLAVHCANGFQPPAPVKVRVS